MANGGGSGSGGGAGQAAIRDDAIELLTGMSGVVVGPNDHLTEGSAENIVDRLLTEFTLVRR